MSYCSLTDFTDSFINTMLFDLERGSSVPPTRENITTDSLIVIHHLCLSFYHDNGKHIFAEGANLREGMSAAEAAGQDLSVSMEGFLNVFDNPMHWAKEQGDAMTEWVKDASEIQAYVDDEGQIFVDYI